MRRIDKISRPKRGFTFVEVLTSISIIVILSSLGLVILTNSQKRARDARRRGDLDAVNSALQLYRTFNPAIGYVVTGSYAGLSAPLAPYVNPLPQDPKNVSPYVYTYSGGGASYTLCATQEILLPASYCLSPP